MPTPHPSPWHRAHPRPWHRGSLFGDGPRRALDREQRARFKFLLRAHRGVGRISAAAEDVGLALLQRLSVVDGRCDPSHAALADDAGCHERTARRATARMRALGLLTWQQRLQRAGERVVQWSNAYLLLTPAGAVLPVARGPIVSGGQTGRETKPLIYQGLSYLPSMPESDRQATKAALANRVRVTEARLLTRA
jgi:hypothetical protein